MIKELMHDPIFLAGKSEVATKEDLQVAQDLLDTLMAHRESCVGMAANMIGVRKRIIAFLDESGRAPTYTVMLNPEIIKKDGAYDTEEGCLILHLDGLIALALTGAAEKRQTAFLGIVRFVLLDDLGIEHHCICRGSSTLVEKSDDALTHTDHIRRHTDTAFSVRHQRIKQVLGDLQIFFGCDL